jgi:prepilin-type processing-associated H-X9-DG protein
MREIGQAIAMYSNVHAGQFPNDLRTIFETGEVTTAVFVCPCTKDAPAPTGPTTQATAAGLMRPGHVSYIYLGKGLRAESATEDTVLLYEPLSNHADGMNVLFGDFHVEWLPAAEASTILKQVAAKRFPVRYPLTQPATTTSSK